MSRIDENYNWMDSTTHEEKLDHIHGEAWEEYQTEQFADFLHSSPKLQNVKVRDRYADFYVGGFDVYPDSHNDDHLNVIGRSSISFHQHAVKKVKKRLFVTEMNVHLPAAPEELKGEIEDTLSLDEFDDVGVYWGSGALGGMPAPEGVVTPHIVHTDDTTFEIAQTVVERVISVFEEVYDDGEKAVKERSEGNE